METNLPADEPKPASTPESPAEAAPVEAPAAEISETLSIPAESVPPPEVEASAETAESTEAAGEGPGDESPAGPPAETDELTQLAEASQRARLSPSDEERMATLLKEALQGGRAGVTRAIEALPKVPWIVGVRAV